MFRSVQCAALRLLDEIYAMYGLALAYENCPNIDQAYRAQKSIHKSVYLLGLHQILTLKNTHCQPWYHCQVFLERSANNSTEFLIVLYGLDLPYPS